MEPDEFEDDEEAYLQMCDALFDEPVFVMQLIKNQLQERNEQ